MQNLPSESSPCNTIAPSEGLAEHSRFFQRLHRRYEQDLPLLPPGAPTRALMEQTLAALRAPVDAFFDDVMVNAEEMDLRLNRQGLLKSLHVAMNRVADLSRLAA